jgi:hypothetical protein
VEALIAVGHPPGDVWSYTPRRIAGFLSLAGKRGAREAAQSLSIAALAARGEPKDIKRQHKDLTRE